MPPVQVELLLPQGHPAESTHYVQASEHCVLEIDIPVQLPHLVDPSLPALPYHMTVEAELDYLHNVRPVIGAIVSGLIDKIIPHNLSTAALFERDILDHPRFMINFYGNMIRDSADINFETGDWKDCQGKLGSGILAYQDHLPVGQIFLIEQFRCQLVHGAIPNLKKGQNPRVIHFDCDKELHDGVVIACAEEYSEHQRAIINSGISSNYRFAPQEVKEPGVWSTGNKL